MRKRKKGINKKYVQKWKKVKISLFINDMVLYLKDPEDFIRKYLDI
jgi:hypothetical protein